jgi:prepilin peptidase CpaA
LIATIVAQIALAALALVASWLDVRYRRLPNWLTLFTAAVGLLVTAFAAGLPELGSHLLHMLAALVVGMVLFRFGIIGGGDAKFYAAVAAWFSLGDAPGLLVSVSVAGLLLFLIWFAWRRAIGKPIRAPASASNSDKLPYAVAIAAGAVLRFVRL